MVRSLLLGLCLLLSACGLGRTPPTDYYALTTQSDMETTAMALHGPRVAVGPLTLPGYLDRNALILHSPGSPQARVKEQAVWSEPIVDGVSRVLCDSLTRRLKPSQGMAFPLRAAIPATWRIAVDVNRLDGAPDGVVILEASWTLIPAHGNTTLESDVVAMGRFVDSTPAGSTLDAFVLAQSQLLERFGAVLAGEILSAEAKKKQQ